MISTGITATRYHHHIVPGDNALSAGDSIPVDGSASIVGDGLADSITRRHGRHGAAVAACCCSFLPLTYLAAAAS